MLSKHEFVFSTVAFAARVFYVKIVLLVLAMFSGVVRAFALQSVD